MAECCDPPITCENNDGSRYGETVSNGGSGFDTAACRIPKRGGGAGFTLKSNLDGIDCKNKICTAEVCCDAPVYCSNNDGNSIGVTGSEFSSASCTLSSHGGSNGYIIKSSLNGVSCGTDRKCQASECCDLLTCAVNNGLTPGRTGTAFTQTNCEDSSLNGTSSFSLKSNLD